MNRYSFSLITLLLIVFGPYWIYLPLILAGLILYPFFWEGVILAFLVDLLYGTSFSHGVLETFRFSLSSLVILLLSVPIRERMRIYV